MNCTAWNSVRAKPLASRPERRAEHGVEDRHDDEQPQRAGDLEPTHPDRECRCDDGLHDGEQSEGEAVAEHEVALAHRGREQPLERARLPLAQRRDAR